MNVAKLALSSHRCTRGLEKSSISAKSNWRTGGNPNRAPIGFGGGGGNTNRKSRAVVSGRTYVRTGKPPKSGSGPGRLRRVAQLVPSRLVWNCPTGGVAPKKATPGPTVIDSAWMRKGWANSYWIQAGLPPSGMGSATVRLRSSSTRAAASMAPPLVVTFGFRSAMRTSSSGTR